MSEELTLLLASGRAGSTGVRSVRRGAPSVSPPAAESGTLPMKEVGTEHHSVATAAVRWRRSGVVVGVAIGFCLVVGVVLLFERSRAATIATSSAAGSTRGMAAPPGPASASNAAPATPSATSSAIPVEALPPAGPTVPASPGRRPRLGASPAPKDSARPAPARPKSTGPDFDYLE
jgi:hypothetical protein